MKIVKAHVWCPLDKDCLLGLNRDVMICGNNKVFWWAWECYKSI